MTSRRFERALHFTIGSRELIKNILFVRAQHSDELT